MNKLDARFMPLYRALVDHPRLWLALWATFLVAVTTALAIKSNGFRHFEYDNGPYIFFTDENVPYRQLRHVEDTYSVDTSLIILYAPADGDIFSREGLVAIEELTAIAWTLPYVLRVNSLANFQHTYSDNGELIADDLYRDAQTLTDAQREHIRDIALHEKTLLRQSVSTDGAVATVTAIVQLDEAQTRALDIMPAAEAALADFRARHPDAYTAFLGDAPFAAATDHVTRDNFTRITPIAMVLVVIAMVVLLRNVYSILACQTVIALSIFFAYAIFILLGFVFSPISAGASPIILTLAVADCVHILATYQYQCGLGKNRRDAMLETLRLNFSPVWMTSVTTAVGFLFMNFADAPPFHDLGNAVFLGVLMAFLLSVTLLPPLMMVLPHAVNTSKATSRREQMNRLAHFTIRHRRKLLWGNTLLAVTLIAFIPQNRVNDILMEYFDDSFEVRRALDFYFAHVGGIQRLELSVPAGKPGGISEPEYLQHLDDLTLWAETLPNVSHVRSFSHIVKRINRNMQDGDPAHYRIPDDPTYIAQLVLMYEIGLPFGLGLDSQVDMDRSETKLEIVFHRVHSDEIVAAREIIQAWMHDNWPAYMQTPITGMDSLFADITYENVYSMAIGTTLALIAVSLLMILSLRSVRYGLLSMLPNLAPAAMTFGLWGIFSGEVGMVVAIIICMTLGIIIDDTVHFLSKYVRARRELQYTPEQATVYAFESVGVAMIATSVILVANFAVVGGFSHYYPNNATGTMVSITIASALLIDFFFFVPLLLQVDKPKPVA